MATTARTHSRTPHGPDTAEVFRHHTAATRIGGGACSLLVRRVGGKVQLLHHAVWEGAAELTDDQARAVGQALIDAAGAR